MQPWLLAAAAAGVWPERSGPRCSSASGNGLAGSTGGDASAESTGGSGTGSSRATRTGAGEWKDGGAPPGGAATAISVKASDAPASVIAVSIRVRAWCHIGMR